MELFIKIVDQKGKPVKNAEVSIGGMDDSYLTNWKGEVWLENVEEGENVVRVNANDESKHFKNHDLEEGMELTIEIAMTDSETSALNKLGTPKRNFAYYFKLVLLVTPFVLLMMWGVPKIVTLVNGASFDDGFSPTIVEPAVVESELIDEPGFFEKIKIYFVEAYEKVTSFIEEMGFWGLAIILISLWVFVDTVGKGQGRDAALMLAAYVVIIIGGWAVSYWVENIYLGTEPLVIQKTAALIPIAVALVTIGYGTFVGGTDYSSPGGFFGVLGIMGVVTNSFGSWQIAMGIPESTFLSYSQMQADKLLGNMELVSFSEWVYKLIFIGLAFFALELIRPKIKFAKVDGSWGVFFTGKPRWIALIVPFAVLLGFRGMMAYLGIAWVSLLVATLGCGALVLVTLRYVAKVDSNKESLKSTVMAIFRDEAAWDGLPTGVLLVVLDVLYRGISVAIV